MLTAAHAPAVPALEEAERYSSLAAAPGNVEAGLGRAGVCVPGPADGGGREGACSGGI